MIDKCPKKLSKKERDIFCDWAERKPISGITARRLETIKQKGLRYLDYEWGIVFDEETWTFTLVRKGNALKER